MEENEQDNIAKEATKEVAKQAKKKAEDAAKEAIKQQLKTAMLALLKSPPFWIAVGIILAVAIFIAAVHYILDKTQNDSTETSKKAIMSISGRIISS